MKKDTAAFKERVCLGLARDLTLKLLERRLLGPERTPEALNLLFRAAFNHWPDQGPALAVMGLSRDVTVKFIERNLLSTPQAAAAALGETAALFLRLSAPLPEDRAQDILSTAKDLAVKLLETGRLSPPDVPELLASLCQAATLETA